MHKKRKERIRILVFFYVTNNKKDKKRVVKCISHDSMSENIIQTKKLLQVISSSEEKCTDQLTNWHIQQQTTINWR